MARREIHTLPSCGGHPVMRDPPWRFGRLWKDDPPEMPADPPLSVGNHSICGTPSHPAQVCASGIRFDGAPTLGYDQKFL